MTWAPIEFPLPGRAQDQVRLSIVKKDKGFGVSILFTGMILTTLGWTAETRVVVEEGMGEQEGWLRIRAATEMDAQGRKLRDVLHTAAARLVTPLFPWMEVTQTKAAEAVETKLQGKTAVLIRLPAWARRPASLVTIDRAVASSRDGVLAAAKQRFGVR
jgi:hypothetical protein